MDKNTKSLEDIFVLTGKYTLLEDFLKLPEGKTVEMDLGCGKGGFTIAMAQTYPDRVVIAADIMLGRLRKVQKKLRRIGAENTHLFRVDARHLLGQIMPDRCLDRIHILCPDPWPKLRHKGHRLLSADFMMSINRVLKENAVFHFSTDDPEYLEAVVKQVNDSELFAPAPLSVLDDVKDFKTEFERDWIAQGKTVTHLAWHALKPEFRGAH